MTQREPRGERQRQLGLGFGERWKCREGSMQRVWKHKFEPGLPLTGRQILAKELTHPLSVFLLLKEKQDG